jgi:poly(hydroxyalkanoate) granule-associated protein
MPQCVIFYFDGYAAARQHLSKMQNQTPAQPGKEDTKMAKKKKKEIQDDIMESAHKVWLAGLGAVAMAEEEGGKFFSGLLEKGQKLEGKSRKQVEKAKGTVSGMKTVAESYWETFGRTIDDQMTAVIHRIAVPTKDEIEALTKKVENLTVAVDNLRKKGAVAPRKAAKKTTTKKATTKKAAAKK